MTSISSPVASLTGTNPIKNAPVTTTSRMVSQTAYSILPSRIGEVQTVSYAHLIGGSVSYYSSYTPGPPGSYAGESWSRTVSIYSPAEYLGLFSEADIQRYRFGSDDLLTALKSMQGEGTAFDFSDRISYENRPTLLASGYGYQGSAVITKIYGLPDTALPEPSSWLLVVLAGLMCSSVRVMRR